MLQSIAHTLLSSIRSTDTLARWGGEEIILLLPETDANGAFLAAEKCRIAVQKMQHPDLPSVTTTFDIALLASTCITPDTTIWTLDKRLLELAKRFGVQFVPASH